MLITYCLTVFPRISGYLTRSSDVRVQSSLIEEAWRFKEFSLGVGNDLLRGLGSVDFPLQQFLIPEYLMSRLFTNDVNFTLLFLTGSLELFLCTLFLGRSLKLSWNVSIAGAWIMALMAFGWTSVKIGSLFWLQPDYAHLIAMFAVLVGLIIRMVDTALVKVVMYGGLFLSILAWLFFSQPSQLVLLLPVLLVICCTVLFQGRKIKSRSSIYFVMVMFGAVLLLGLFGFLSYLNGLVDYTSVKFFGNELFNDRTDKGFISEFLFGYPNGKRFFVLGLIGLVVAIVTKNIHRSAIFGMISSLVLIWVYGYFNTHSAHEIGPSANYMEHLVFPFFALGVAITFQSVLNVLVRKLSVSRLPNRFLFIFRALRDMSALLIPILMFAVTAVWIIRTQDEGFTESQRSLYPPKETTIVAVLKKEIGLYENSKYRGRALTITDPEIITKSTDDKWVGVSIFEQYMDTSIGNEHRHSGLIYFGIPRLSQYNPHVSPAFFRFATRFLSYDTDVQNRNEVLTRRVNLPVLRMLGVRFIISNRDMPSLLLREQIVLPNESKVSLYDIGAVNVGNYSPTKVVVSESLVESFGVIGNPDFDAKVAVVSDVDISGSFVPVSTSSISHKGNDLLVEGTSPGTSILLLPFEFSRCFDVTARSGEKPILFRANTLLTGVVFKGSVDVWLKYRTGPFHNSTCRIQDSKDFTKLLENTASK